MNFQYIIILLPNLDKKKHNVCKKINLDCYVFIIFNAVKFVLIFLKISRFLVITFDSMIKF